MCSGFPSQARLATCSACGVQAQRATPRQRISYGVVKEPRLSRTATRVTLRMQISGLCDEDLALVGVIRRTDHALLLHLLDEARGAVVADPQLALDPRDGCVARRLDDVHRLVVHVVVALAAGQRELALRIAVVLARFEDVEVV